MYRAIPPWVYQHPSMVYSLYPALHSNVWVHSDEALGSERENPMGEEPQSLSES